MARPVRVHIDEAAVSSFIQPGGDVHALQTRVVRNTRIFAMEYLYSHGHVRSAKLVRGIQTTLPKTTGPWTAKGEVRSTARHSVWVHEGVHHRIYGHPFLLVPRHRMAHVTRSAGAGADLYNAWKGRGKKGRRGFIRLESVRGQHAKPFLTTGMHHALIAEALL